MAGTQVIESVKPEAAPQIVNQSGYAAMASPGPETAEALSPPRYQEKSTLPDKLNICIYRFPFGGLEHATCVNWLIGVTHVLHAHDRVNSVSTEVINDTPVDMSRNRAIRHAIDNGMDFAVFVDSDMFPDLEMSQQDHDARARTFFPDALNYAIEHFPCCVGAPYNSQPPEEQVLVMRWNQQETHDPDGQIALEKFTREEAIGRYGFEEVAALGTGLLLIPIAPLKVIPGPWFTYQWKDTERTRKVSTEDVVFTRDLGLAGIPQICYWSAYAGHWKLKLVCRPIGLPALRIPQRMALAIRRQVAIEQGAKNGTGNAQ